VVDEATPHRRARDSRASVEGENANFLHSWAGSSKRIKLSGTFLVKAGFDLASGRAVDVRPDEILIQLPHAEIVGIEEKMWTCSPSKMVFGTELPAPISRMNWRNFRKWRGVRPWNRFAGGSGKELQRQLTNESTRARP